MQNDFINSFCEINLCVASARMDGERALKMCVSSSSAGGTRRCSVLRSCANISGKVAEGLGW